MGHSAVGESLMIRPVVAEIRLIVRPVSVVQKLRVLRLMRVTSVASI